MEIKTFKKEKGNKYKIIFSDDSDITLYDDVIVKYNLLVNKKIDKIKLEEIAKYNSSLDAYYLSLKYISKKMRTKLEIKKYLEKKEFNPNIIKETIDKLIKYKAIDENLYIRAFCNDQINFSNIGPNKIIKKLETLGIDKSTSKEYLNTIDYNIWIDKINKIVDKKIKTNKNYSVYILKNKILMALVNDGFDREMIREILSQKDITVSSDLVKKEYEKMHKKLSKKYDGNSLDYQIKIKLKAKGFSTEEIDKIKTGF